MKKALVLGAMVLAVAFSLMTNSAQADHWRSSGRHYHHSCSPSRSFGYGYGGGYYQSYRPSSGFYYSSPGFSIGVGTIYSRPSYGFGGGYYDNFGYGGGYGRCR